MSNFPLRHPSLEASNSAGELTSNRSSLFDHKDAFIERVGPIGMAAIYFGSFTLAPQDGPLSRQALFKLSFLHRHFLSPGGLQISVQQQTAIFSGEVSNRALIIMADLLARQIEDILQVKDETELPAGVAAFPTPKELIQFLVATDQTLHSGVRVTPGNDGLILEGQVSSAAQKKWAEQLAEVAGEEIESRLSVEAVLESSSSETAQPPVLDDESLQALILFRLRLVRETESLSIKVKANRGIVTLSGKVPLESHRQRVENLTRSTLGLRELRSSLSVIA